MKALILKNDLTAVFINKVGGQHLTYRGGDYVLSPECVNRRLDLSDKRTPPESEIIFFENGSAPIPIDVDFSDKKKIEEKTATYLNAVILENFLENTGFTPGPGIMGYISQAGKLFTVRNAVILILGGSLALSLFNRIVLT